jgi:CheY-like chemotaxis protein
MQALSVLVADGDPDSLVILTTILRHEGFHVIEAATGSEALELLRVHEPTAVITDLTLRHADGIAVLRHVKSRWPHVPVIILTATVWAEGRRAAEAEGCAAFLMKPRTPRDVVRDLRGALVSGAAAGGSPPTGPEWPGGYPRSEIRT